MCPIILFEVILMTLLSHLFWQEVINDKGEATSWGILFKFPVNHMRKSNSSEEINQFSGTKKPLPSHTQSCWSTSQESTQPYRLLRVNQSTRTGMFLFLSKVELVGERG